MAQTHLDIRQSETRVLQGQLNSTAVKSMDSTLASINNEVTATGRLIAQATPSLVVSVGSNLVVNPNTSKNRVTNTINGVSVSFAGGTITFPAASGNITVSPGASAPIVMGPSQFVAVLVQLSSSGTLDLIVGTPVASIGAVVIPTASTSKLSLGYIIAQSNASSVIQNITNAMLYQYTTEPVGSVGVTLAIPNFFLSPAGSGNGTTFAQALAALPAVGGVILLMDAIAVTTAITIPHNVKILGRDRNATITFSGAGQFLVTGSNVILEELQLIDGSTTGINLVWNQSGGDFFLVSRCIFNMINDISGGTSTGIAVKISANAARVTNSEFTGVLSQQAAGIEIELGTSDFSQDNNAFTT